MTPEQVKQPLLAALVSAVLVTAVMLGVLLSATQVWSSTAVLSIDQPGAIAASDDSGVIDKLSRLRFKYVGLVETDRIAAPVAEDLDEPLEDVRDRLSGEAELQNLLIKATGTDDTEEGAMRTATALADALVAQVAADQKAVAAPPVLKVSLSVVRPAEDAEQIAPSRVRAVAVALLLGLVAGAAVGGALVVRRGLRRPDLGA